MGSLTFAEAAEHVLREERTAMPVKALWAAIAEQDLVESEGETPEATLQVELERRSANSSAARRVGSPRFYRRGDGAYGLWAHLTPAQQRMVIESAQSETKPEAAAAQDLDQLRNKVEFAREVFARLEVYEGKVLEAWYGLFKTGDPKYYAALTS